MKPIGAASVRPAPEAMRPPVDAHRGHRLPRQLADVRNTSDEHTSVRKRPGPESAQGATEAKRRAPCPKVERGADAHAHRNTPMRLLDVARIRLNATSDPRACRDLFEKIDAQLRPAGLRLQRYDFNQLLLTCVRGKDMDLAWDVYQSMATRKPAIEGDLYTFNILAGGFGASGNTSRNAELTDHMALLRIQPDAITQTGIMNGFANAGKPEGAERVLRWMQSQPDPDLPTPVHFNVAIKAWEMANQPAEGLRLMQEMQALNPPMNIDPVLFGKTLFACTRTGDWNTALEVKRCMEAESPPAPLNGYTWKALLHSFTNGGHPDGAEEVLRQMQRAHVQIGLVHYGAVIACFHNAGRPFRARQLLLEARAAGVVAWTGGYDTTRNILNFHSAAVAGDPRIKDGHKGVPAGLAVTLLDWLLDSHTLDENTRFVVGEGHGRVRNAVLDALEQRGRHYVVHPAIAGMLIPA